ncbi:Uncharacterised protein [Bordetella pertussis]|nr:Uncharacterised protein [Bordetella pertussis]
MPLMAVVRLPSKWVSSSSVMAAASRLLQSCSTR